MSRSLKLTLLLSVLIMLSGVRPIMAQDAQAAQITSPQSGQSLFGSVTITGTATHPQFQRYKVEFTSEETSTPEWLLIAEVTQQVTNGALAQWNTSLVPDGRYQLRLRVILRDGTVLQTVITSLTISNKIPTALPTALQPATPLPPTDAPTAGPSPTPLIQQPPTNTPRPLLPTATATFGPLPAADDPTPPLVVAFDALRGAFCTGAYCSLGVFAALAVYAFFRARLRPYLGRGTRRE